MIEAQHLLVDTNVWLDYYLQEGAFDAAKHLVELAEAGKIGLLYAPTTAKDVFYILPRRLARRNVNGMNVSFALASWACIEHMMQVQPPLRFRWQSARWRACLASACRILKTTSSSLRARQQTLTT